MEIQTDEISLIILLNSDHYMVIIHAFIIKLLLRLTLVSFSTPTYTFYKSQALYIPYFQCKACKATKQLSKAK